MKSIKLLSIGLFASIFSFAQEADKPEFKVSGKPEVSVFSNFNSTTTNGETANTFGVTRAYLGYKLNLSENWSARATMDFGATDGAGKYDQVGFLKFAYIQYEKNNLKLNFGLTGNTLFDLQEKAWGKRYVYKTFMDINGFGNSADYGLTASYKIKEIATLNAKIMNGEGFKKGPSDSSLIVGGGIDLFPIKGLTIRLVADYIKKANVEQTTVGSLVGYKNEKFSLNAEYNYQMNNKNVADKDLSGISVYGDVKLCEKCSIFGRYDLLGSNIINPATKPWNLSKNGQTIIGGFEYQATKNLYFSPNIQTTISDDSTIENPFGVYLNVWFNL